MTRIRTNDIMIPRQIRIQILLDIPIKRYILRLLSIMASHRISTPRRIPAQGQVSVHSGTESDHEPYANAASDYDSSTSSED